MKIHGKNRRENCPICKRVFDSPEAVKNHQAATMHYTKRDTEEQDLARDDERKAVVSWLRGFEAQTRKLADGRISPHCEQETMAAIFLDVAAVCISRGDHLRKE